MIFGQKQRIIQILIILKSRSDHNKYLGMSIGQENPFNSTGSQGGKTVNLSEDNIPGAGLSIVFIFGGLFYAGILKMISRKIRIPLNPLLLISGIMFGSYYKSLGFVGESIKLISELNPNGILAIFLPTLIFESAFELEWHMLKKQIEQTLIMGVPCVICSSIMIMAGVKLIIGYDDLSYTWIQAFLLGCILSCTDIFSFANKLRQYGTPQRIISLIEGESLFNYCSCVLIFQIINEVVIDVQNYSIFSLLQLLLEQTVGGIIFGLFFGAIALFIVKRISQDGILVVTIMTTFCYTIYLTAQFSLLRVSGIISIVTFGIFMNAFGKQRIVGQAATVMRNFWSYSVFIAETCIFLIAGVFVGVNVFYIEDLMDYDEIKNIIILYLLVLVSRYLGIICFQKSLSSLGYGLQLKETLIITFAGLKGAVGISFAMIIFENTSYSIKCSNYFLLHVTSNSLLTLVINGTMTWMLMNFLKLSTITKIEYKFFKEYLEEFCSQIEEKKQELKGEKYLNYMKWDEIDEKIGVNDYKKLIIELEKRISESQDEDCPDFERKKFYSLEDALKQFANKNNPANNMAEDQLKKQNMRFYILVELRKRFIKNLKYKFWSYHEQYNTMPDAVKLLTEAANFDLDAHVEELETWRWIKNHFSSNIKFVSELRKNYILGSFARDYLFSYISYCYDVVSSYIQANQEVRAEFREGKFVGKFSNEDMLELILSESQQNQKQAFNFLQNYLKPSFPEIQKQVKTRKASFGILLSFSNMVNRFYETGQLEQSEYSMLENIIAKKILSLQLHNPKWKSPPLKDSLKNHNVFGLLPDKILSVIEDKLVYLETFDANEIIQTNFTIAKYIYFIRRGGCTAEFINGHQIYKQSLKVNDIYGVESLVSSTYRSTITSNTLMIVVGVKKNHIDKIMDYFSDFEQAFWKNYLYILLKTMAVNRDIIYYVCNHLPKKEVEHIINTKFFLHRIEPGEMQIQEDAIFLRGCIEIYSEEEEKHEKVPPMTIFLASDNQKIRIVEKSSIMLGQLPIDKLESELFSPGGVRKKTSMISPGRKTDFKLSLKQM